MSGVTLEYAAYGRLSEVFENIDFDEHPQKDDLIQAVSDVAQEFAKSEISDLRSVVGQLLEECRNGEHESMSESMFWRLRAGMQSQTAGGKPVIKECK